MRHQDKDSTNARPAHVQPLRLARTNHVARTAFTTSRLLEFTSTDEISKLVGCGPPYWPLVAIKELADNALDACEDVGVAPEIAVEIDTGKGTIAVVDNGPGLAPEVVARLLDFRAKTSSREAYVGPTRGQQGNALQSLLAMPFVLDRDHGGGRGETTIEARGVGHRIVFTIDPIRREPRIEHSRLPSLVQNGTRLTLHWPNSACSTLVDCKDWIAQIVRRFGWLNPHASFSLDWDSRRTLKMAATTPGWLKWVPSDPAPAHWYDRETFGRLIAACITHDEDHGRDRTVREFAAEFRGFARSEAQKRLLANLDASRMSLRDCFDSPAMVEALLSTMWEMTKPVPARDLGLLGKQHFMSRFDEMGVDPDTFKYSRAICDIRGMPFAVEVAFGYVPHEVDGREILTGLNWTPTLINPFRRIGYTSLDSLLQEQRAGSDEPIILALHLISPRIVYTDKGKSAVELPAAVALELQNAVINGTQQWARIRKAEERDASARARRRERFAKRKEISIKDAAEAVIVQAYSEVSDDGAGGRLPANARQIMYAARRLILAANPEQRIWGRDTYFTQTLLPDFINDHPEITSNWDVVYDERGHFTEPHTDLSFGLGTLAVREYLKNVAAPKLTDASIAPARVDTHGPQGRYGNALFVEKEGFDALLDRMQLAKRLDLAITSTKGMSVTALRQLVDHLCGKLGVRVFVLHDFDKSGFSILGTIATSGRRYAFNHDIGGMVIDLGLRLTDAVDLGLSGEPVDVGKQESRSTIARTLRGHGATEEEIDYLLGEARGDRITGRRVELNELTSRQFADLIEQKLIEHGVAKIVPDDHDLSELYRMTVRGREIEAIVTRQVAKRADIEVPADLAAQVRDYLTKYPTASWDAAVAAIAAKPNEEHARCDGGAT